MFEAVTETGSPERGAGFKGRTCLDMSQVLRSILDGDAQKVARYQDVRLRGAIHDSRAQDRVLLLCVVDSDWVYVCYIFLIKISPFAN